MDHLTSLTFSVVISFLFFLIQYVESVEQILTEDTMTMNKMHPVYDCVDFYKQPAFKHPLLANHTFHYNMRPSSTPKMMGSNTKLLMNDTENLLKGKNCPIGTVPIRRITKEDRIREKLHVQKYDESTLNSDEGPRTEFAIIRTRPNSTQKYYGASASISVWNPVVEDSQYSSGQMVLKIGKDTMQVGWTVTPTLYGDHRTHLFIYTNAGETQCFNTYCPAFVIVDKDFVVDEVLTESHRGGPTNFVTFLIHKDEGDGNWWLGVGPNFKPVGFWPNKIFSNDAARFIYWGGRVYGPTVVTPPMGSGEWLHGENVVEDASCKHVRIVNGYHKLVDFVDDLSWICTSLRYEVDVFKITSELGRFATWGGPGGWGHGDGLRGHGQSKPEDKYILP